MATIYLVRHGQSQASITGVYGTNSPLTQVGITQAQAAAKVFESTAIDAIIAAPLQRAQQTAAIIAKSHSLAVQTVTNLREPLYGQLEGINRKVAKTLYPLQYKLRETLTDDNRLDFKIVPNMETDREAFTRFYQALTHLASTNPNKTLLIISHVPLMKLLLVNLGFATRQQLSGESINNGGFIKLSYANGVFSVQQTAGLTMQPK